MATKDLAANLGKALDGVVAEVVTSMINTKAAPVGDPAQAEKLAAVAVGVNAWLEVTGPVNVALLLNASPAAATKIAAKVLGDGMGPDEENEVLKELTNMFAGPMEKVLTEGGIKGSRGVPGIVRGGTPGPAVCAKPAILLRAYGLPEIAQFFTLTIHASD